MPFPFSNKALLLPCSTQGWRWMNAKKNTEGGHWFIWLMTGLQIAVILGFFFGLWLLFQDYQFSRRAAPAQAEVVDIVYSDRFSAVRGATGGINIYPVFSFIDQNGTRQTVKPIVAMSGRFRIGDIRDILFDPANPSQRVQLAGWRFYTGIGGIILLVTTPMAGIFIWGQIRHKSQKNQQRLRRNRKARERRARIKAEKEKND